MGNRRIVKGGGAMTLAIDQQFSDAHAPPREVRMAALKVVCCYAADAADALLLELADALALLEEEEDDNG